MRCVVLRGLDGRWTHWLRYYRVGKAWFTTCGAVPSQAENEHRGVKDAKTAIKLLTCNTCKANLARAISTAKNVAWEDLFHGFD